MSRSYVVSAFRRTYIVSALALWIAAATLAAQAPAKTTWDGVFTAEQAMRGAGLYAQHCALCHAPALTGAEGPPLTGVDFASNWNGLTVADLYDRIRTSMPPDDPAKVSAQDKVDIVAHILSTSKFPAGMMELPRDAPLLQQIKFVATKP